MMTETQAQELFENYLQKSPDPQAKERFAWFGVLSEEAVITPPLIVTLWQIEETDAADHLERFQQATLLLSTPAVLIRGQSYPGYRLDGKFQELARTLLSLNPPQGLGYSAQRAHQILLERYQARCERQAANRLQWASLPDDGYIHTHLAWHMEQAGQFEALVALLSEETAEGRNAWFEAREYIAQTGGFIEDVRRT